MSVSGSDVGCLATADERSDSSRRTDASHKPSERASEPRPTQQIQNKHGIDEYTHPSTLQRMSQQQASLNRSIHRRVAMSDHQRELTAALNESRSLWYALRRHGGPSEVESWLKTMAEHSTWKNDREQQEERLRTAWRAE
eukprot:s1968_g27.t1